MNSPPVSALPPGAAGLHTRRCVRHSEREAAARCPSCGEFFCRECVVEYKGKLLCAGCLAKASAATGRRRERLAVLRRVGGVVAGAAALWLSLYAVGAVLQKIPPNFHDGTIWKDLSKRTAP